MGLDFTNFARMARGSFRGPAKAKYVPTGQGLQQPNANRASTPKPGSKYAPTINPYHNSGQLDGAIGKGPAADYTAWRQHLAQVKQTQAAAKPPPQRSSPNLWTRIQSVGHSLNAQAPKQPAFRTTNPNPVDLGHRVKNDVTSAWQHANPFSGVHNANKLIGGMQKSYGLTPGFVRTMHNANASISDGKDMSKLKAGGLNYARMSKTHVNQVEVNAKNKAGGDTPQSEIMHEALHQVWNNNPKTRQQFISTFNKTATPEMKAYVAHRTSGAIYGRGKNTKGDTANLSKAPANIQNEVHSYMAQYFTDPLSPASDKNHPLYKYYSQYFDPSKARAANDALVKKQANIPANEQIVDKNLTVKKVPLPAHPQLGKAYPTNKVTGLAYETSSGKSYSLKGEYNVPHQSIPGALKGAAKTVLSGPLDVVHQAGKQAHYLSSPSATQQQRNAIMTNQGKAAQAIKAGKYAPTKGGTVAGGVKLNAMMAKGDARGSVNTFNKQDIKAGNNLQKRGVADFAQTESLVVGGGSTAKLATGGVKAGAKAFAKSGGINAVAGGAGNAGYTVQHDPNAKTKDVLKSVAYGVGGGVAGTAAGKVIGIGVSKARAAVGRDAAVNSLVSKTNTNRMIGMGRIANTPKKVSVSGESSSVAGKVSTVREKGTGIPVKASSTPAVLKPQTVTPKAYSGEFSKISKGYDTEAAQIAKLPPVAQQAKQAALDARAQRSLDALNERAGKTQFTVKDLKPQSSVLPAKERQVTGKKITFNDLTPKTKTVPIDGVKVSKTKAAPGIVRSSSEKLQPVSGPDLTTKAPKAKADLNEAGGVPVGKAAGAVKDMLDKHKQSTEFSGDIAEGSHRVDGAKKTFLQDGAKLIKNTQKLPNSDKKLLQEYRDQKAAGLTPQPLPKHLQDHDAAVTALNKEAQKNDAELARLNGQESKAKTIESRDAASYTHREAANKGSSLDYLLQGDRKSPVKTTGLSKTTSSTKARTYHALTDEQGNRRVVAIKNSTVKVDGKTVAQGKLVTGINNGGKSIEHLGKLDLKTNADRMTKELAPVQRKIDTLEKEQKVLSATKSRSDAASKRLANIKTELEGHYQNHQAITTKYDPEELAGKTFVGKDGKKYTIGQATTSEITKHTGQKYYVDPHLMATKNYVESRTALENARYVESIKQHPDFEKFASAPGQTAPKGWRAVDGLMQFQGYRFEPKTAEVLTDIVKRTSGSDKSMLDQASNFLKQTIVAVPVKHTINEGMTYAIDRGLSSLANPMAYKRGIQSLVEAFHEVTNQGEKFQAAQKAGLHTVTGGDDAFNKAFTKQLKTVASDERAIGETAKAFGTSPVRLYKAIQNLTVWQTQDILNMSRVLERTYNKTLSKGQSIEDAVKSAQRYNLQYSVPSRIGPKILPGKVQRGMANTLRSPKVFFGTYRYDVWRIPMNIIKDTTNLKTLIKDPKQNAQALDKLAALAFATAVVWPAVDKGIQKISGNPNAYMKAPGSAEIPSDIKGVVQGNKSARQFVNNQLYVSSAVTTGMDLKNNTDSFTKKTIADPNASAKKQASQTGKWLLNQAAPVQNYKNVKKAPGAAGVALGLAGARFPKNSPNATKVSSLQYDSLPMVRSEVKNDYKSGNDAAGQKAKDAYNAAIVKAYKASKNVTDDGQAIKELKKQRAYLSASDKTIARWKSGK